MNNVLKTALSNNSIEIFITIFVTISIIQAIVTFTMPFIVISINNKLKRIIRQNTSIIEQNDTLNKTSQYTYDITCKISKNTETQTKNKHE